MGEQRQHPQEVVRSKEELERRNMKASGCKIERRVELGSMPFRVEPNNLIVWRPG